MWLQQVHTLEGQCLGGSLLENYEQGPHGAEQSCWPEEVETEARHVGGHKPRHKAQFWLPLEAWGHICSTDIAREELNTTANLQ